MGFSFAETMAGTIEWDEQPGVTHPFRFEVIAEADSTRTHFKDGRATLRGKIYAPPHADGVPAEGTITIRPFGERFIRYELSFVGDDGKSYEMVGQKDIRWTAPITTFTNLPAEIVDDQHRRVARCTTNFNVKQDLAVFLRSFRVR